jgi:hypothetical protein
MKKAWARLRNALRERLDESEETYRRLSSVDSPLARSLGASHKATTLIEISSLRRTLADMDRIEKETLKQS